MSLLVWVPSPARLPAAIALSLFFTVVLAADRIHLRFFHDVTSAAELVHAWQLPAVSSTLSAAIRPKDLLYFVDIAAALMLVPWYVRAISAHPAPTLTMQVTVSLGILLLAALVSIAPLRFMRRDREHVLEERFARRQIVHVMGFVPYHVYDLATTLAAAVSGFQVSAEQKARAAAVLGERRAARQTRSPLFGAAAGKNLIVVQAESLNSFAIGLIVEGQMVAPHMTTFASESLSFSNFFDQTFTGATSDATFLAMQSLHPVSVGAVATRFGSHHFRGLPAVLAEAGYTTQSMSADAADYWNQRTLYHRLGFQRSMYDSDYPGAERLGLGVADHELFTRAVSVLHDLPTPFMALVLSLSSHMPFDIPPRHRALRLGGLEETPLGNYLHAVNYLDRAFGAFLAAVRASGLLERSAFVLYGDHESRVGERERVAGLCGFSPDNHLEYWHVVKHVPFMVRMPNGRHAGVSTVTGGHVDIAPTILALLGLSADDAVMLGTDLTAGQDALVVFRDGSLACGPYRSIEPPGAGARRQCIHVETRAEISCSELEHYRAETARRLEASDIIIQGDLVPMLAKK